MPAGLGNRLAADQEPRTGQEPPLERHDESIIGAARIAHGGESAPQIPGQSDRRILAEERRRHMRHRVEIRRRQARMHVRVDQSRHHGLTAAVDPAGVLDRDSRRGDFPDPIVFDEHVAGLGELIVNAVEKPPVFENRQGHASRPRDVA